MLTLKEKDAAMLKVIDKAQYTEIHPAPLLFAHGAWHADRDRRYQGV